jgi:hypothetical protein
MGYDVTHLVEYRAEPERYFTGLTLTELDRKYGAVSNLRSKVENRFGSKASRRLGEAFSVVLGIREGVELSEILMEYRWRDFEWNTEELVAAALDAQPGLENPGSAVQKATAGALVESQMPPRHPNLNRSTLAQQLSSTDAFYFYGFGNRSAWELKEEDVSIPERALGGVYGEKSFRRRHLPENTSGYVLDTSNRGALSNAELRERMLETGARNYVGFASVAEPVSASVMWNEFATDELTVGEAARSGVNLARTGRLLYNRAPDTYGALMLDSLTVFGDPEAIKDPIGGGIGRVDKSCDKGVCDLEIRFEPNNSFVESAGTKLLDIGNKSRLAVPGRPAVPLYTKELSVHPEAELEGKETAADFRGVEDLALPRSRHVGRNNSLRPNPADTFPETKAALEAREAEIVAAAAGAKSTRDGNSVLESTTLRATYSAPLTLSLESRNSTAHAKVHSDADRSGTLLFQNRSRAVDIDEGTNSFELADINRTRSFEARLVTDTARLEAETTLSPAPNISVSGFDPRASETTEVSAAVRNQNSECVGLKANVSGAAALDIMEDPYRRLCPDDPPATWSVTGMWRGNASIQINSTRETARVEAAPRHTTLLDPVKTVERALSRTSSVEWNTSGAQQQLEWESHEVYLRHVRNPTETRTVLQTPRFRAEKAASGSSSSTEVTTPSGKWTRRSFNAKSSVSGTMERPDDILSLMRRERSKVRRLSNNRRTTH